MRHVPDDQGGGQFGDPLLVHDGWLAQQCYRKAGEMQKDRDAVT
jgi:hypothetical protein